MIDLTPLDVRKKKSDFTRTLRGYDPPAVDQFLELVADRMEELVRDNTALSERVSQISASLSGYREREQAMNEALVAAQQLTGPEVGAIGSFDRLGALIGAAASGSPA